MHSPAPGRKPNQTRAGLRSAWHRRAEARVLRRRCPVASAEMADLAKITEVLDISTAARIANIAHHRERVQLGVDAQGNTLTSFVGNIIIGLPVGPVAPWK